VHGMHLTAGGEATSTMLLSCCAALSLLSCCAALSRLHLPRQCRRNELRLTVHCCCT
jgi:hypothetical protein